MISDVQKQSQRIQASWGFNRCLLLLHSRHEQILKRPCLALFGGTENAWCEDSKVGNPGSYRRWTPVWANQESSWLRSESFPSLPLLAATFARSAGLTVSIFSWSPWSYMADAVPWCFWWGLLHRWVWKMTIIRHFWSYGGSGGHWAKGGVVCSVRQGPLSWQPQTPSMALRSD